MVLFGSVLSLRPVLFDFFGDGGVAPRAALLGTLVRENRLSVYDVAGPSWVLVAIYLATLFAIVAFTVGFHSRLATIATFVLFCGLDERNLLGARAGDAIARPILFWLMFAPVGARYSVDAVRRARRGAPIVAAGFAFPIRLVQLQLVWVYLCSVLYKLGGTSWRDGSALHSVLGLEHYCVTRLGHWAFGQAWLSRAGTYGTLAIEAAFFPLVLVLPGRPARGWLSRWPSALFQPTWKLVALVGGVGLHVGIALMMHVNTFSLVMLALYVILLEPQWIAAAVARFGIVEAGATARAAVPAGPAQALLCGALTLLMGCSLWFSLPERSTLAGIDLSPNLMPDWIYDTVHEAETWQHWSIFAPNPPGMDSFLTGRGALADGTTVDVLRGDLGAGRGPVVHDEGLDSPWVNYLFQISYEPDNSPWTLAFGRFLCRKWNGVVGRSPLQTFKL